MKTSTFIQQNSFCNDYKDADMNTLTEIEIDFYEDIKPSLNSLLKNPSEEVVEKILAFSKTI